jgi:hypothetical protein
MKLKTVSDAWVVYLGFDMLGGVSPVSRQAQCSTRSRADDGEILGGVVAGAIIGNAIANSPPPGYPPPPAAYYGPPPPAYAMEKEGAGICAKHAFAGKN